MKSKRTMTLDRVLSRFGRASRTDARDMILAGQVKVNGAVVRDPGDGQVVLACGQLAEQQGEYAARQMLADFNGKFERPYVPHMDGLLISLGSYAGVGSVGPVWVRELLARVMKIGAETRYLFNVGGVALMLARGLLLRHEVVTLTRMLSGTKQTPSMKGKGRGNVVA